MPVDVVPSKLTCKFLKPASCSTLELKGLIGSPKNLLVHMISAQARGSNVQIENPACSPERCRATMTF